MSEASPTDPDAPGRHGSERLEVLAVDGVPEVRSGDDLSDLLLTALREPLHDGDVVVVSSKVVAKAAGLVTATPREDAIEAATGRVVASRGAMRIVRLGSGLTLAAAGVDESNTEAGTVVPLPPDPDASARDLRDRLQTSTGLRLAVVVTDTAGRAWRTGQTDMAIGVAGLVPLLDLAGTPDAGGMPLRVTAPAVADEVAGAADLVRGKSRGRPFAVVRGLAHLGTGTSAGPGAGVLVRPESDDLFGLGSRDAVRAAVRRDDPADHRGFPDSGAPALWADELLADAVAGLDADLVGLEVVRSDIAHSVSVLLRARPEGDVLSAAAWLAVGGLAERVRVLTAARRADVLPRPVPLEEELARPGWALLALEIVAGE